MYKGNFEAWGKIYRGEGLRGVFTGWGPTFVGYSVRLCLSFVTAFYSLTSLQIQGGLKYGGYEYFKKLFADLAGEENAYRYKTALYLAASASAEFFADIGLCPLEAVKVRIQTTIPPFARGTMDGIPKITSTEGVAG